MSALLSHTALTTRRALVTALHKGIPVTPAGNNTHTLSKQSINPSATPEFYSDAHNIGKVSFPKFNNLAVMMMPFILGNKKSMPRNILGEYVDMVDQLANSPALEQHIGGVAYLTIDEAVVPAGVTHRRPGLHVDGATLHCGWAVPAPWAKKPKLDDLNKYSGGMVVAASVLGSCGWVQPFRGTPNQTNQSGNCEHLANQCLSDKKILLKGGEAFWASGSFVHTAIPSSNTEDTKRQFLRISPPNPNAPWYEGYTTNPLGIKPTGPTLPRRESMDYRQKMLTNLQEPSDKTTQTR